MLFRIETFRIPYVSINVAEAKSIANIASKTSPRKKVFIKIKTLAIET